MFTRNRRVYFIFVFVFDLTMNGLIERNENDINHNKYISLKVKSEDKIVHRVVSTRNNRRTRNLSYCMYNYHIPKISII